VRDFTNSLVSRSLTGSTVWCVSYLAMWASIFETRYVVYTIHRIKDITDEKSLPCWYFYRTPCSEIDMDSILLCKSMGSRTLTLYYGICNDSMHCVVSPYPGDVKYHRSPSRVNRGPCLLIVTFASSLVYGCVKGRSRRRLWRCHDKMIFRIIQ
jgi:hypothetical protein